MRFHRIANIIYEILDYIMITENPKFLKILIISAFAVIIPVSIIGINFYEKNVSNPRIWENWTCDEMEQFAMEDKDDNLNDYQTSKFHEDLTECLGR